MIATLLFSVILVVLLLAMFDWLVECHKRYLARQGWKREWPDDVHENLIRYRTVWKGEK